MKISQVFLIALREFITRARGKGFIFVTILMFLGAIAAPIGASFIPALSETAQELTIIIQDGPEGLEEVIEYVAGDVYDIEFAETDLTGDALDQAMLEREVKARVVIEDASDNPTYVWRRGVDPSVENLIDVAYTRMSIAQRAQDNNVSKEVLAELLEPVTHQTRIADPAALDRAERIKEDMRRSVAMIGLFTAFFIPQVFGQFTMLSVIEEKSSRVIEVVLSQVKTTTLLAGKIVGLSALGLVQMSLIFTAFIGSLITLRSVEVPASVWRFVPFYIICVIFALLMYVTLFALVGSLISRQEDASQVMMPVLLPLMAGWGVGQFAVNGEADHPVVQAMTWFPLTSPMLLPVRIAREAITNFELWGALVVQALAIFFLMWLAARIFEFTLLRTGSRVTWREMFGSLRKSDDRLAR